MTSKLRMTREQAEEVYARMDAALREVGVRENYDIYVDQCTDPSCDCGWDVWWTRVGSALGNEEGVTILWRAYCSAGVVDMVCRACFLHQIATMEASIDVCLSVGTPFLEDCGRDR